MSSNIPHKGAIIEVMEKNIEQQYRQAAEKIYGYPGTCIVPEESTVDQREQGAWVEVKVWVKSTDLE